MQTVEGLNHAFLIFPLPIQKSSRQQLQSENYSCAELLLRLICRACLHHGCRLAVIALSSTSAASQQRRCAWQLPLHMHVSSVIHVVSVAGISLNSFSNYLLKRICEWSNINDNSCGSQDYLRGVHHRRSSSRMVDGPLKHRQWVGSFCRLWKVRWT